MEKLTGREMLEMFARLRGIPAHKIAPVVNAAIKQLNLSNWADKMCGNYRYVILLKRMVDFENKLEKL